MTSLHAIVGLSLLLNSVSPPAPPAAKMAESPSQYCGLNCVYAAAKVCGVRCEFETLLNPAYLTGQSGSSAAQLRQAVHDIGLHGYESDFMTVEQLWLLDKPAILHVRPPGAGLRYQHWVLFLGFDGDCVKLYDPPRDVGTLTTAELLSMWDGVGIVLDRQASLASFPMPFPLSLIAFVIATVGLIAVGSRWLQGWKLAVSIAIAMAFVAHGVLPFGFLRSPTAVASVQRAYSSLDFPSVDLNQARRMIASGNCAVVDARIARNYATFHLPGALSIPIDSSYLSLNYKASMIDRHKPVIIYCQSESCHWAGDIAAQLAMRGVTNIYWYHGGVYEWKAAKP